jgi:hypothetical protein
MQLETETKKLEQEVENLLERMADLHHQEGAAQLGEVVKSQTERRTLKREQERFVNLRQRYLSSNTIHPSSDEQPDDLRQPEQNDRPEQQEGIAPSETETSFCE